jgi:hypothetical protein
LPQADLLRRAQVALLFQTVKERVECAGAKPVPVSGQFLNNARAEDRLLAGVRENVKPD